MLTADCMGHDSVSCPVLLCQCPSDLGIPGGEGTSVHDCFGLFFSSVRFHIVLVWPLRDKVNMLENSFFVSLHSGEFPKIFMFSECSQQSSSNQFLLTSQYFGFNSWNPWLFLLPAVSFCSFTMMRGRERSVKRISQREQLPVSFPGCCSLTPVSN